MFCQQIKLFEPVCTSPGATFAGPFVIPLNRRLNGIQRQGLSYFAVVPRSKTPM